MELVWAAGFFDGEGCFHRRGGKYNYFRVYLCQKDPRPLQRFADAVGVGNVTTRSDGVSTYQLSGKKAEEVAEKILPYLSAPKIEQYVRVREG